VRSKEVVLRIPLLASLFLLLGGATLPPAMATDDHAVLLRNVTIVDVERGTLRLRRDVVIMGKRIVGIQAGRTARAPKQGRVLDGTGKFLIPGLWDFHVHVFSAPGEEDFALPLYIVNGITGVRDAGALRTLAEQQRVAQAVERGERVGPRLVLAGALIDGPPGSWPDQMVAVNADEGRARVREAQALGWTFIKSYSLLSEAAYLAIADEARRRQLPLFGHIPESVRLDTAVRAGHRSIEHFGRVTQACSSAEAAMIAANAAALREADPMPALIRAMAGHNKATFDHWDAAQCERTVRLLARMRTAVMPSLMVSDFYLGKDPPADDPRLRTVPQAVRAQWGQGDWRRQQMSPEMLEQGPRSVALDWLTFKLAHDAGVPILAGTDAAFANPFLFHGFTLHDELARYVQAGLTPQQALVTATVNPARFFGRRDLAGRVGLRQKADLVLLDANPLDDVAATRRIHAVVANGRLFNREALGALQRDVENKAAR
jgi:imidazolonepropionase-like amidohydrolase